MGAVAVDFLRFGMDAPAIVGYLSFAFVWLAVHQCGFFYADRIPALGNRRAVAAATFAGLTVTVLLVCGAPTRCRW